MKEKMQWKALAACILLPLATGALSAFLTKDGMEAFQSVQKPAGTPPDWIFPVVWTILYACMGIASYLAYVSGENVKKALSVYGIQLVFNFFWTIFFFNLQWYLFAFLWLAALWLLILWTARLFFARAKAAGYLLLPYLVWVAYAGYLNFGVYWVN